MSSLFWHSVAEFHDYSKIPSHNSGIISRCFWKPHNISSSNRRIPTRCCKTKGKWNKDSRHGGNGLKSLNGALVYTERRTGQESAETQHVIFFTCATKQIGLQQQAVTLLTLSSACLDCESSLRIVSKYGGKTELSTKFFLFDVFYCN